MIRVDGRLANQLRSVKITPNVQEYAEGSCLIEFGKTRVLCTATVDPKPAAHLIGTGRGWVTAEYAMLPRSSKQRIPRDRDRGANGRTQEIQRLIGRSLRAVTELDSLGERTFIIDCDVIQADGGTRTAAITGGFVALALAMKKLVGLGQMTRPLLKDYVAAVSVGRVEGAAALDLCYLEDAQAEVDMNVVMTGAGEFVELQGTAEHGSYTRAQLDEMLAIAGEGIASLIAMQREVIGIPSFAELKSGGSAGTR